MLHTPHRPHVGRCCLMLLFPVLLIGCTATVATFNQKAYEQATSLKVEALALMDKAVDPSSDYGTAIASLKLEVEEAYEYAKGLPKNDESIHQWEIIRNPDHNSLFGFLRRWEQMGPLDQPFIDEAKGLVSEGFDAVVGLESGKPRP